jgi:hypothetical protein
MDITLQWSDIALSRDAYLREEDEWETGSMTSTAILEGGTPAGTPNVDDPGRCEYFNSMRDKYIRDGPRRGGDHVRVAQASAVYYPCDRGIRPAATDVQRGVSASSAWCWRFAHATRDDET